MSFLGAHECCRISDLDFGLVLGFGSTISKGTISFGFSLDQDRLVFLGSEFVWFFRIGIRLVFLRIGIRFFVGLDVGFSGLDGWFFKGSGCFVFRNWMFSFADTKM
jgi:hypothetical protein